MNKTVSCEVYMHDPDNQIYAAYNSYRSLVSRLGNYTLRISGRKVSSEKLAEPFDTACRNYKLETEFESQMHCISLCVANESISRNGRWPRLTVPAYEPLDIPMQSNRDSRDQEAHEKCTSDCSRSDCYSNSYFIEASPTSGSKEDLLDTQFSIAVEASTQPVLKTVSVPIMTLATYLSTLAGCIYFWSGFCPWTFAEVDSKYQTKKFKERFSSGSRRRPYQAVSLVLMSAGFALHIFRFSFDYFTYPTISSLTFEDMSREQMNADHLLPVYDVCANQSLKFQYANDGTEDQHMTLMENNDEDNITTIILRYKVFNVSCASLRRNPRSSEEQTNKYLAMPTIHYLTSSAEAFVSLHSIKNQFIDSANSVYMIRRTKSILTYEILQRRLMPAPYQTSCSNYNSISNDTSNDSSVRIVFCFLLRFSILSELQFSTL